MVQGNAAGFNKNIAISFPGQVQYAITGFVKLLGVFVLFEQSFHVPVKFFRVVIPTLQVICGATLFIILVVGTQVFLPGGITCFFVVPGMRGNKACFMVDPHQRPGVDYLDLHANVGIGNAVIVFVHSQVNMIVLGHFMFPVIFDLEGCFR